MRVAVLGAQGQLGAAVVRECSAGHDVVGFDRAALDVTDYAAVAAGLRGIRPEVIVNCTGFNAVDAAEDHPVDALQVNAIALRTLARAAQAGGSALVHYSSDFVFDGEGTEPYTEADRPNPRGAYAASKLVGEWFAADAPTCYVLRVESLFGRTPNGPSPKGSVAMIVDGLVSQAPLKVFGDRTISPTYIVDAAWATRELLERQVMPGLYHCVNSGQCTWAEFATEAARVLGVRPSFEVVPVAHVKLRAPRPKYCVLSNQKLASVGIRMPTWQDALVRYLSNGSTTAHGCH